MNEERNAALLAPGEGHWLAWLGHPIRYIGPDEPVPPPSHEEIERLLSIAPEYGIEIRIPKGPH